MPEPAIETQQLVRDFKKGPRAVDRIDLRVESGEVYGFLGPNGAGKSTTVHMLTTLLPPTAGRAWVAGHDVVEDGAEVRATIGAALQDAALDPFLTGREHMKLQTALHGMRGADARERSETLLDRVGLTQAADRRVGGYSGGMKRRLDLALALVHRPRILFLDEPTTGLDPSSRSDMWKEVSHVARGTPEELKGEIGRPTLEVTPADREDRGTVESVLSRFGTAAPAPPEAAAVRLSGGAEALAAVVRALDAEDVAMRDFQLHAPTLDDVFLAKTGRKLDAGDEENTGEHPEAVPA